MLEISKKVKDAKENIYMKQCLKCNKVFVGIGKGWFGLCDKCNNKIKEGDDK